jgi:hypothetical protein
MTAWLTSWDEFKNALSLSDGALNRLQELADTPRDLVVFCRGAQASLLDDLHRAGYVKNATVEKMKRMLDCWPVVFSLTGVALTDDEIVTHFAPSPSEFAQRPIKVRPHNVKPATWLMLLKTSRELFGGSERTADDDDDDGGGVDLDVAPAVVTRRIVSETVETAMMRSKDRFKLDFSHPLVQKRIVDSAIARALNEEAPTIASVLDKIKDDDAKTLTAIDFSIGLHRRSFAARGAHRALSSGQPD